MAQETIGRKRWAIADGYLPAWSHGPEPEMVSHGAVCVLNATRETAVIQLTLYFSNRDPAGPYQFETPPQRTKHVRFNDLQVPGPVPRGVDFALVVTSNVPVVVQHTRLDSRQAENALMTTLAYGE